MKKLLFYLAFISVAHSGVGQAIGSLNLNYLYNPQNDIDFQMKLVKTSDNLKIYYSLRIATVQFTLDNCSIAWQKRDSFGQREGTSITPEGTETSVSADGTKTGTLTFPLPDKPWLLVAKVSAPTVSKNWLYCRLMEANYPVNGFLSSSFGIVNKPFVLPGNEYIVHGSGSAKSLRASFYRDDFHPASPPFVDNESAVDRFIFHDSTFTVKEGDKIKFNSRGLYLLQEDTNAAEGFAFRNANGAYPKYSRVEDLVNPLIYVCAPEEYDQLKNSNGDKAKFDKVILDITRDKERAKNFMRSYFRRVELANLYFSSYKEGWKTDRGMIYLIFGAPDEVIKSSQNETWNYKNLSESFSFVKTGSVYDPDYFVLVREKRFAETWFNTIDLWRKSRF